MDTRSNIFTQIEQVEFIPVSPCHDQLIEYRHYFLSLAWPNDMKIIIVQECRWLSWNLQTFYSIGEDKVNGLFISLTIIHMRATQHFYRGLLLSTPKEKKIISKKHTEIFLEFLVFFSKQIKGKSKNNKNYLHGKAPNKQKKNKEIFLGFLFSDTAKHA